MLFNLLASFCFSLHLAAAEDLFANWFTDQRNEIIDEKAMLQVEGTIPPYVNGKLIRVGPTVLQMGDKNLSNYIDGFGRVSSWSIDGYRNTAYFQSAIIKSLVWNHSVEDDTVARHITQEKTEPKTRPGAFQLKEMDNTDVNVYRFKGKDSFLTFTDFYLSNEIHLESLRTIGSVEYTGNVPDAGFFSSSHPREYIHPESGETFLINWVGVKTLTGSAIYVFSMDENMKRTVIGQVDIGFLPYSIHSISVVENYVSIVVSPVSIDFLKAGVNLCLSCSSKDNMSTEPTRVYIFSLASLESNSGSGTDDAEVSGQGPIATATYTTAFHVFHHINGWITRTSENSPDILTLDMCSYDTMDGVLGENVLGNLVDTLDPEVRDKMQYLCDSIKRIEIALPNTEISDVNTATNIEVSNIDLPLIDEAGNEYRVDFVTINPLFLEQTHCIAYGVTHHALGSARYEDMGLVKIDTCAAAENVKRGQNVEAYASTATVTNILFQEGVFIGEPLFIPDPDSEKEDGGVLLMVTKHGVDNLTKLQIVDAATFAIEASITAPFPLMFEFHGQFFPDTN